MPFPPEVSNFLGTQVETMNTTITLNGIIDQKSICNAHVLFG
jgi:hypothetical protein